MGGLTLALPKGRIFEEAVGLLVRCGLLKTPLKERSRKLVHEEADSRLKFLLLRASDVPTYVEHGAADLGIVGRDILEEQGKNLYEPLDLGLCACRLSVAGPEGSPPWEELKTRIDLRVATTFPNLTQRFFAGEGMQVEVIELRGALELAPQVGLSDLIVDLVQTGSTLRANGLVELKEVLPSTARLILNRASQKTKYEAIAALIKRLRRGLKG
ncbi:MAG: ATP phosphoribosyltransferase [Nitrospinota bacterium]